MGLPISNAFNSIYSELNTLPDVSKLKASDIDRLKEKIPNNSKWNISPLERSRVSRDIKKFGPEVNRRVALIADTAQNGFQDIKAAIKKNGHNCLINSSKLIDLIDNPELTIGEKRQQIVKELISELSLVKNDPSKKAKLAQISPEEKQKLLALKQAFINAASTDEKIEVLDKLESHQNLALVSMDDPQFVNGLLFEIPRHAAKKGLLSLFFQGEVEKYHPPASYKDLEESIKKTDGYTIPLNLAEWTEKLENASSSATRILTPALKDLSKRLTKKTKVSVGEYFQAVFSSKMRREIAERKILARSIPEIDALRQKVKFKSQDRAHFKNVKRNCLEIEKNPRLPALRLQARMELDKDISLSELDNALDRLNEGSVGHVQDLILKYEIKNEEAFLKLLAIRLAHFPALAAALSSNNYDNSPELKQFVRKLNLARSTVLRTLASYE